MRSPVPNPGGQGWSEVLKAFADFAQEACGATEFQNGLLERYRAASQARLTETQLDAALSFLQSKDGQTFSVAFSDVHRDVSEHFTAVSVSMREQAFRNFQRRVDEIIPAKP